MGLNLFHMFIHFVKFEHTNMANTTQPGVKAMYVDN